MAFFILPINLISFILNYNNMDKSKQKRCSHEKCNKKLKLITTRISNGPALIEGSRSVQTPSNK